MKVHKMSMVFKLVECLHELLERPFFNVDSDIFPGACSVCSPKMINDQVVVVIVVFEHVVMKVLRVPDAMGTQVDEMLGGVVERVVGWDVGRVVEREVMGRDVDRKVVKRVLRGAAKGVVES